MLLAISNSLFIISIQLMFNQLCSATILWYMYRIFYAHLTLSEYIYIHIFWVLCAKPCAMQCHAFHMCTKYRVQWLMKWRYLFVNWATSHRLSLWLIYTNAFYSISLHNYYDDDDCIAIRIIEDWHCFSLHCTQTCGIMATCSIWTFKLVNHS